MTRTLALIQARMSSSRFPGKVLTSFRGRPIVKHIVETARSAEGIDDVIVLTSDESTDLPLVKYLAAEQIPYFVGPLNDVFDRFRRCVQAHPCGYFVRLCADSPLLRREVIESVSQLADPHIDLVSTRLGLPNPKGQNAELVRTESFLAIDDRSLDESDREHVTPYYYRHPEQFRLLAARTVEFPESLDGYAIDTPEDLVRLEQKESLK